MAEYLQRGFIFCSSKMAQRKHKKSTEAATEANIQDGKDFKASNPPTLNGYILINPFVSIILVAVTKYLVGMTQSGEGHTGSQVRSHSPYGERPAPFLALGA